MLDGDLRKDLAVLSAKLMALTAQTAPKSKGEDDVEIAVIEGEEKDRIVEKMLEMAESREKNFVRDAESVKKADAILLIGVYGSKTLGLGCGACGFESCRAFEEFERKEGKDFSGPNCAFKLIDLGIAIGSAAKLASILGADTRVMYRIGTAARKLGLAKSDVVMGIPVSVTAKNPFFDR
ncbi:ferredoxin domain-containing protein [Geoglobus acetivorans]|uniref:Ferredoxin domain containing protein n=1 Tax=Geoglobus acetivorans TaxID=565033 RepID=A0A0A7GI26_GEOAI|nr:Ferredoxin domain containing protein [Geoglobus acetivorans]